MNKFITIPTDFIIDENTTLKEKILICEIHNLSSLEKGCIASNKHFESLLGFSQKSVSNSISNLVKKGILSIKLSDRNNIRIIKIIDNYTLNLLSTKSGGVSTKSGGVSTKSGESKENKQVNKQVNKKTSKKVKTTPFDIITFYRENISNQQEKIREQKSFNLLALKANELEVIFTGLKNYKEYLELRNIEEKFIKSLKNFIEDKIYLDFQKEIKNKEIAEWDSYGLDYDHDKEWK